MFDRAYRQRLEADLARWEADGVLAPATVAQMRASLPPLSSGINIPVVVAIVGGLLIAAAFLAFVAAHWIEIPRPLRFAILVAGIVVANGLGAWFARTQHSVLSDLCASVGAIIFGAGIALVGQMYHLGEDFAGGMLLWSVGAFVTAALTGSRGALAVALVAGCIWSGMRSYDATNVLHLPFLVLWLAAAGLAWAWHSRVASHLAALAAMSWWISTAVASAMHLGPSVEPFFILAVGAASLAGGGFVLAATSSERTVCLGSVFSTYGAFSLAAVATLEVLTAADPIFGSSGAAGQPLWAILCGVAGVVLAVVAGAITRRAGTFFATGAIGLVMVAALGWTARPSSEPWLAYAFALCAMLCLVVSGMLDDARPRIVAGWLGLAGVIAGITWSVDGSLLGRSAFLAVAGILTVVLATLLNRLLPRADR